MPTKKAKAAVPAPPGEHRAYACDNCDRFITLVSAQCVTNATTHLHACSYAECVRALEERLGTAV